MAVKGKVQLIAGERTPIGFHKRKSKQIIWLKGYDYSYKQL